MNFLVELQARLRTALNHLVTEVLPVSGQQPVDVEPVNLEPFVQMLRPAQDRRFGDFQANCAMPLKGILKLAPPEIARKIVSLLDVNDLCDPPEVAGPGFINFRLRNDRLAQATAALLADERLGVPLADPPRKIIVDYSAPNVAKPMHVGHLRSTVLGNALDRILRFLGHDVLSDNHIGDWGTQFGMIIYGYKHLRNEAAYQQTPVPELARLYRLVNQLSDYHDLQRTRPALLEKLETLVNAEVAARSAAAAQPADKDLARASKKCTTDLEAARSELASSEAKVAAIDQQPELAALAAAHPAIAELARKETAKLHAGDPENLALWHQFLPQCLTALEGVYQRLGISFDMTLGESYYNPLLAPLVEKLLTSGLAEVSDGAVCVFVEGNRAPFIVRKADGAFTYATTDLATITDRVDRLHADEVLYVVDARQSEHFQLLFATAAKLGYTHTKLRHISFGTILGNDRRPYKTRSGDTIGLEGLLDEAVEQALAVVRDSEFVQQLDESQRLQIAETVGLGGIFYADLHHNRESDYVFSWEKMLAKDGDTATYIQYAYARVQGIFRRGEVDPLALRNGALPILLETPAERLLAVQLNRFGSALDEVTFDYRPNLLTQYLYETATTFAAFFDACPVLREERAELRSSRLALCDLTARTLKTGLQLLGIHVAEQM